MDSRRTHARSADGAGRDAPSAAARPARTIAIRHGRAPQGARSASGRTRLMHFHPLAAATLLAAASTGSLACSTCGCTLDADWASQGVTTRTGWTADLRYDFFNQDDLRRGLHRVDRASLQLPNDEEIQSETINRNATLTLDRGLTPDLGVTFQLPWHERRHTTIAEGDTERSSSRSDSLGDARLLARWTGLSAAQDWGLQFGLKLPTGDSHGVDFDAGPQQGEPLDRGLQPGTGSTDLLLGAFRFGALDPQADWFGQALLQVAIAHERAFRPGNALNLSAGLRYRGFGAIVPQAQLNARLEKRESGSEADQPNSGATLVYFSPGVAWSATPRTSLYLFGQLPVYQRVNGLQLEPKWSVSAGVHLAF
jgi:hypothetical protein